MGDLQSRHPDLERSKSILDIGAGIGLLYEQLRPVLKSDARYVALEPVTDIALHLKAKYPEALILNSDINQADIPDKTFDVTFVCGVDYLFVDIDAAFKKISRITKPHGLIVIQRNVFLDQTGYAAKPIRNSREMFSDNAIIRNWFHSEQYRIYLNSIFSIESHRRIETTVPFNNESFKTFTDTYICKPLDIIPTQVQRQSFFGESKRLLSELSANSAAGALPASTERPASPPQSPIKSGLRFY